MRVVSFRYLRGLSLIVNPTDAYKLDVPDEVMAHPAIVAMEEAANDFKTWCNVSFVSKSFDEMSL